MREANFGAAENGRSGIEAVQAGRADTVRRGLERLQQLKTGALISSACRCGALLGQAAAADLAALGDFGLKLGLAFQIADDLLDVEGSTEVVGKQTGKDAARGKATFVSILGVDNARAQAMALAMYDNDYRRAYDAFVNKQKPKFEGD